ncbi:MAG TPA: DUF4328 domain-containing protein [Bacteroidales bacterium]|nr:DUF4328 domain-containing protein [Bacteroidales bacterium]HPT52402.1 DUF4328 domain-containing protein [Bacteroidales bacterium]
MKKIKNHALWGQITMGLNLLLAIVVVLVITSMVKFDRVNGELQDIKPGYDNIQDSLQAKKADMREIEGLNEKYLKEIQSFKKDTSSENKIEQLQNEIKKNQNRIDSVLTVEYNQIHEVAAPIIKQYTEKSIPVNDARQSNNMWVIILIALFFVKTLMFGYWSYSNMKNLRAIASWQKHSTCPWWGIVGWFVPLYNLIKPCSVFSEMWSETNYLLKQKAIVADDKDNGQMETIGAWWALVIIVKNVLPFLIGGMMLGLNFYLLFFANGDFFNMGTIFGNTGLYLKLNHTFIIVLAIILWIVYLLYESYLIIRYNKMATILYNNQDKFQD